MPLKGSKETLLIHKKCSNLISFHGSYSKSIRVISTLNKAKVNSNKLFNFGLFS